MVACMKQGDCIYSLISNSFLKFSSKIFKIFIIIKLLISSPREAKRYQEYKIHANRHLLYSPQISLSNRKLVNIIINQIPKHLQMKRKRA